MPKKRKVPIEELVVPPQNQKICGTICICQMTAILSLVSIVYLSVAIYIPSYRAFYSGMVVNPVMCSTSKVVNAEKCNWGSCGEWCLSKTSGACAQIHVNLRENGSSIYFENCTNPFNKTCHGIDQDNVKKYRCKQEECKNLTGTFNCTSGNCINITDVFECVFKDTEDELICSGNRGKINCMDIEGLNTCMEGKCAKIKTPYNCDRRCVDFPTRNKNVIILNGDRVFLSNCEKAKRNNDDKITIWNENESTILMASCFIVENYSPEEMFASDCINGTLVAKGTFSDLTNLTYLYYLTTFNDTRTDRELTIAPLETDLLIANDSKLLINLEGCVNTLRDECKEFIKKYGRDGADHNAKARFPCYYSTIDQSTVVARFDLNQTYKEFLPAAVIPLCLFIVSCFILVLCQRTVEVGDDAKMRFKKRTGATIASLPECAGETRTCLIPTKNRSETKTVTL